MNQFESTIREEILTAMTVAVTYTFADKGEIEQLVELTAEKIEAAHQLDVERAVREARKDELKRAIDWFEDSSGYIFYLDDRLAQLTPNPKGDL